MQKKSLHSFFIFLTEVILTLILSSNTYGFGFIPWQGTIVDNENDKPIEGAVIVRSWDEVYGPPGLQVEKLKTYKETNSDENGHFNIFGIFPSIWRSENKPVIFKPGYKFLVLKDKSSIIKLEKIPDTYYLRYEEAKKVRNNYQVDFYETRLLKKMVKDEEEFIKSLNKYVPGVWYTGFVSPRDIAIDQKDNIFITDGYYRQIYKFSPKGERFLVSKGGSGGCIDIEIDQSGDSYIFKGRTIYYGKNRIPINGLPGGEERFALGPNKGVFVIVDIRSFLFKYDLDGNLLCKHKVANKNSTQEEGDIQLIDIDSSPDGKIIVACSYFNPYWDKGRNRYVSRNGILIFDQNCNELFYKEINIDSKVRSIEATGSGFVVADKKNIYFYDKNISLLFKEEIKGKELGGVSIIRILSDSSGTYLYIIEGQYDRILKYNLKTRKFCIR